MSISGVTAQLDQLAALLSDRRVTPPVPVGQVPQVADDDADEGDPGSPRGGDSVGRGLFIVYRAANGAVTRRRITVQQLIGHPPEFMLARCHERNAPRNFRFDRIVEAIDPESGEVLPVADLAQLLQAEHGPIDPVLRRAIHVLVFLAHCDGEAVRSEWSAIDDSLALYLVRFGGNDADHQRACRMARQVAPDGEDLVIAMRSFTASPNRREIAGWLVQALKAVIDADGTQTRAEFAWIRRIEDFLNVMRKER